MTPPMSVDRALTEILALCHTMDVSVRDRVEGAARDLYAEIARRDEAHRTAASTAVMALERAAEVLEIAKDSLAPARLWTNAGLLEEADMTEAIADCRAAVGVLRG